MNLIFELFTSKLSWQFSWKSEKKNFHPFFKTFLTNQGKSKTENEKIWENEFDFWIFHIIIRLYSTFHKNLRKKTFLTNWGKNENENGKNWKNEFDFWILHIKIRLYSNLYENLRKKFHVELFLEEALFDE